SSSSCYFGNSHFSVFYILYIFRDGCRSEVVRIIFWLIIPMGASDWGLSGRILYFPRWFFSSCLDGLYPRNLDVISFNSCSNRCNTCFWRLGCNGARLWGIKDKPLKYGEGRWCYSDYFITSMGARLFWSAAYYRTFYGDAICKRCTSSQIHWYDMDDSWLVW